MPDSGQSVFPAQGHKKRVSGGQNCRRNCGRIFGRSVFPAQAHKKCVSGGQNLRFARNRGGWEILSLPRSVFPAQGRQKRVSRGLRRSKFAFPAGVSSKSVMYECPTRVSGQSVPQECQVRVSCTSVK